MKPQVKSLFDKDRPPRKVGDKYTMVGDDKVYTVAEFICNDKSFDYIEDAILEMENAVSIVLVRNVELNTTCWVNDSFAIDNLNYEY